MAILDILKRKKIEKEKIKEEKGPAKVEPEKKMPKIEEKLEVSKPKAGISDIAWKILKSPHITEKATDLTKKNQYIFKIEPRANKVEVKKAIESLYGVDVLDVKIINVPRKRRRLGRISGWKKGYKKAIVKIKEGQKIEVLPR